MKIQLSNGELNHYLGLFVEKIIKDHIIKNHKGIMLIAFPEQSKQTSIKIFNIDSQKNMIFKGMKINRARIQYGDNPTIYGWNGDMALLLNDGEHGKKALIIEIKYGSTSTLTKPQSDFFCKVSTHKADYFMDKLQELKIFIIHCKSINIYTGEIEYNLFQYKAGQKFKVEGGLGNE
ncbi:hypothetical protein KAU43_06345 [candidate division WOR-3 bacterium]|nr:hypothetical protein [candidate division WOR-3 bacterium]